LNLPTSPRAAYSTAFNPLTNAQGDWNEYSTTNPNLVNANVNSPEGPNNQQRETFKVNFRSRNRERKRMIGASHNGGNGTTNRNNLRKWPKKWQSTKTYQQGTITISGTSGWDTGRDNVLITASGGQVVYNSANDIQPDGQPNMPVGGPNTFTPQPIQFNFSGPTKIHIKVSQSDRNNNSTNKSAGAFVLRVNIQSN